MIKAAIAGGTGYTGGELLRILLRHPEVEVVAATTTSSEGTPVSDIHRDLIGETDLEFGTELNEPDVIFLCLGHGLSREFISTWGTISDWTGTMPEGNSYTVSAKVQRMTSGMHMTSPIRDVSPRPYSWLSCRLQGTGSSGTKST